MVIQGIPGFSPTYLCSSQGASLLNVNLFPDVEGASLGISLWVLGGRLERVMNIICVWTSLWLAGGSRTASPTRGEVDPLMRCLIC